MNAFENALWVFVAVVLTGYLAFRVGVEYERAHGVRPECVKPGTTIRAPFKVLS